MKMTELEIPGSFVIETDVVEDRRGYYAPLWHSAEFVRRGLPTDFAQINLSFSERRGTLRGLHWQAAPHEEAKLVLCTRGKIFDVIVDTRPASPTRGRWVGLTISSSDHRMVYVPHGCAHGLLTLEDACEILYTSTAERQPGSERGMRYDDRGVGIAWPDEIRVISDKDLAWPAFESAEGRGAVAAQPAGHEVR